MGGLSCKQTINVIVEKEYCTYLFNRDGGVYEERRRHGCGTHSGGAEPIISGLQECDWSSESFLEDNQQYRTEGRDQGCRGQAEDDQGIQANGKAVSKGT